jgi:uroporphyrinogen decarboxylase
MTPVNQFSPHLLVRAARGEAVERVPVWAMRQAGRWDPEFSKLRGGLSFYEFSENVELSARTSLLPRRFGVDAIILFYDITTLTVAMGLPFTLQPAKGPVPDKPIRHLADVERLDTALDSRSFDHILQLLKCVRDELSGALPVIVFAGAPFTVATYCIGTGKNMQATRSFAKEQPAVWEKLLERIQHATIHFLKVLIAAGADVYQLFDSWAGMLERAEYLRWAQPHHQDILREATGVPRILFVKEGPAELLAESGADVISLGKSHDLRALRAVYPNLVFQGNVDETLLQKGGSAEVIEATRQCLTAGGGRRHILNLSHGVDKATPVTNFEAFVQTAKDFRAY